MLPRSSDRLRGSHAISNKVRLGISGTAVVGAKIRPELLEANARAPDLKAYVAVMLS
jgi:hypothetical protein